MLSFFYNKGCWDFSRL